MAASASKKSNPTRHASCASIAAGTLRPRTDDVAPPVWPSLAALEPFRKSASYSVFGFTVAPAVTALGRVVMPFLDVTATRVAPIHDAIVDRMPEQERGDVLIAGFQAAWDELGSTPDGRAVIDVCRAAAEGGALLGRFTTSMTAEENGLALRLAYHYGGKDCLSHLLAALRFYREQQW